MIKIKYLSYYGKTIIIFIIIEIFISFILSFFELFGMDTGLLKLLSLLANISVYAFYGYKYGKITTKKAWQEGLTLGLIFNLILIITNLLFFRTISALSIIYYFILITIIIIFTIIGKNNKKESTLNKK